MNIQDPLRRLDFRLFADIDPTPKKNWLVANFLGEGEMSCGYGPPGSTKSLIIGDMGAHIAADRPWFGRRVAHGAVLYVACERGALVKRRFAAWRSHYGITDIPLAVVSDSIDLRNNVKDADAIIRAADELHGMTSTAVRLIIVDTASRALAGGDENSPKDMGAFVANLARIQDRTGAHLLTTHHVPSGDTEKMRGHGAFLAACDTTLVMERAGDLRSATVKKTNDGDEGERVTYRLESVELYRDPETDEATTAPVVIPIDGQPAAATGEPKLSANQRTMFTILHAAGAAGLTTEDWNARAREAGLGVKRRPDLLDFKEALKSKGFVREFGDRWTVHHG